MKDFVWTDESQKAFEDLKKYMAEPPLLAKPNSGEVLYLYLFVSDKATSAVLVKEEEKIQKARLLCEQSFAWGQVKLPIHREIFFGNDNKLQES